MEETISYLKGELERYKKELIEREVNFQDRPGNRASVALERTTTEYSFKTIMLNCKAESNCSRGRPKSWRTR